MNTQIEIKKYGTTTLATAGKYCDRNIDVNVEVDDTAAYEAGQKAEYDAFWDAFQDYGQRKNYRYAFSGYGWKDENFKPKYDIAPPYTGPNMFTYAKITDLKACLEFNGVTLDVSKITNVSQLFGYCENLTILPKIDLSSATSTSGIFADDYKLKTIDELVVSANTGYHNTNFRNCEALENMIVTGTIGQNNFNVQWSTKLTHDSLMSIINCLADKSGDTSGTTWAVTIGSENYAKLTANEIAIAENKGWDVI
jgi:peroxiredoxin